MAWDFDSEVCGNCKWWGAGIDPLRKVEDGPIGEDGGWHGRCRIDPPKSVYGWPRTTRDDWCGKFEECSVNTIVDSANPPLPPNPKSP